MANRQGTREINGFVLSAANRRFAVDESCLQAVSQCRGRSARATSGDTVYAADERNGAMKNAVAVNIALDFAENIIINAERMTK